MVLDVLRAAAPSTTFLNISRYNWHDLHMNSYGPSAVLGKGLKKIGEP